MTNGIRLVVASILLVAAGSPVGAGELPRYGVFVFSDECVQDNQSGDVRGDRITLLRFPAGDMAIYQYGAGPFEGPILADSVTIDEKRSTISILLKDEFGAGATVGVLGEDKIEGTVSNDEMIVTLEGDWQKRKLPRIPGLPKQVPTCR